MVHNRLPPLRPAPIAAVLVAAVARASLVLAAEPTVPAAEQPTPVGPASTDATGASESAPETSKDSSQINTTIDKPESNLPWRDTSLHFEQTVSTQTVGLETSPQLTYVPLYEWWLSFRPRYYFTDKLFASARFDYYKDFTNAAQTTEYRQDIFGDIWANLVYATGVPAISKHTEVSAGARLRFPTSLESQGEGVYVRAGALVGIKQVIPINGLSAKYFSNAHVALGLWYEHPFSRATTPTNPNLDYTRQDTEGMSFVSDQVSGTTLVNHQLVASIDTGLQITSKLALNVDMIFFNQWHYGLPSTCVATLTGCAAVGTTPGFGTTYTVDTWFVTSIDYELVDELTLTLGYYNLTNEIAPDGQRRGLVGQDNIWWSPDARIFFDITANLDTIYEWASGKPTHPPQSQNRTATAPNGPLGSSDL